MIRIETTAEFDTEGKFTVTGTTTEPVSPGSHTVVLLVNDSAAPKTTVNQNAEAPLQRINGMLVFTGQLLEDPEEVRQRLDDERLRQLLGESAE